MSKLLNRILLSFVVIVLISTCKETTKYEIDETPPNLSIISPIPNEIISEVDVIVVNTDDNVGISKVEFYINDIIVKTQFESPFYYDWITTQFVDGDYTIKVISYDTSNNFTESQTILVKIDNSLSYPSEVSILSIVEESDNLIITWNKTTDNDITYCELERSLDSSRVGFLGLFGTMNMEDTLFVDSNISSSQYISYRIIMTDMYDLSTTGP
ncbi:MAG: hypothetical protein GWP19_10055, partial [Planctomycetia bacterium]|nr:hypothetical protein [Planctomycetia bacterium]